MIPMKMLTLRETLAKGLVTPETVKLLSTVEPDRGEVIWRLIWLDFTDTGVVAVSDVVDWPGNVRCPVMGAFRKESPC